MKVLSFLRFSKMIKNACRNPASCVIRPHGLRFSVELWRWKITTNTCDLTLKRRQTTSVAHSGFSLQWDLEAVKITITCKGLYTLQSSRDSCHQKLISLDHINTRLVSKTGSYKFSTLHSSQHCLYKRQTAIRQRIVWIIRVLLSSYLFVPSAVCRLS